MGTGGWFSYSSSGSGEPRDDAYSRFTNPERFKPLAELGPGGCGSTTN